MKEKITAFFEANKKPIVQIGGSLAGGILGLVLTMIILSATDEELVELEDIGLE